MTIRFVYDIVCPYAYLGFRQLDRLRALTDVALVPVLLGGLLRHAKAPDDPATVMSPVRAAANRRDFAAWADFLGVSLRTPDGHPRRSLDAMRILSAASPQGRHAWTETLFRGYWEQGRDISDRKVLRSLMAPHDVDVDAAIEAGRTPLRTATAEAFHAGAFGVPTWLGGPRHLWGQDRLGLLLRDLGAEVRADAWAQPLSGPSGMQGQSGGRSGLRAAPVTSVRFVHDFASPFSYLASTQVERLVSEAGLRVEWSPVLLGALFRSIGTPDVPLHAMPEARAAYVRQDMHDWAEAWGVPFRFPSHFPMRSVLPLRASIVQPDCSAAIYRAAWAEDRRIDTPETLGEVLEEAGFDAPRILSAATDPAVKGALRDNTERAEAEGICGVPTFVVTYADGRVLRLWGQDRLVLLRGALRGWVPADDAAL